MLGAMRASEILENFDAALAELVERVRPAGPERWRMTGVNAAHAAENPDPGPAETLGYLEESARTLDTLLGVVVPFHIRWHAGSIRATWD